MTESNVTDRTLERLRLGELSKDEAADVMQRLEEAGETARLERLIEADEAFLERYPAAAAVSQIREVARRRRRAEAAEDRTPEMATETRPRWRWLAVPGVLAALAMIYVAIASEPAQNQAISEQSTTAETSESSQGGVAELPPPEPARPWRGLLDWTVHNAQEEITAFGCYPGETVTIDARNVARVSVEETRLVEARGGNDEIELKCLETGITTVNFMLKDRDRTNVIVRVAPPYHELPQSRLSSEKELQMRLDECGELQEMALQIVVEKGRFPAMVMVGGGTETQRECVRERAKKFEPRGTATPFSLVKMDF